MKKQIEMNQPFVCHLLTTQEIYDALAVQFECDKYSFRMDKSKIDYLRPDAEVPTLCWLEVRIDNPEDIMKLFNAGVNAGYDIAKEKMESLYKPYMDAVIKSNNSIINKTMNND